MTGYLYLATPYTNYPNGPEAAYLEACRQSSILLAADLVVYSPIVHCHPLLKFMPYTDGTYETWCKFDQTMIERSSGLVLCKLPSWETSKGMSDERAFCERLQKPVIEMAPGEVPAELRPSTWISLGEAAERVVRGMK